MEVVVNQKDMYNYLGKNARVIMCISLIIRKFHFTGARGSPELRWRG